jgi:GNAT superfamily N-acetyltransferase
MLNISVRISHLADHPETLPLLQSWLEQEWPSWYGPSSCGDVFADLLSYANRDSLPVGVVAYIDDELCGMAALKYEGIAGHTHLLPWAGAGFVVSHLRNRGIGTNLLKALEVEARSLGYDKVYCGTTGAVSLLKRSGWQEMSQVSHNGESVFVLAKVF